jgi:iduronate 2-sulfatase
MSKFIQGKIHHPYIKGSLLKSLILPLSFSLAANAAGDQQKKKMNVLFIAVDDMNNDLGCYGHPLVKSPNIDRLASRGIAFANSYCQFPLSSPSRSSLLTGLRPDRTRVFNLTYHFRQDMPDIVTLPRMFINNGYYVARTGKMYHYGNPGDIGTNGLDDKLSWTERYNPAGRDKTSLEPDIINYTPKRGLGSSMSFLNDLTGKDEEHTDGKVAEDAIRLMKNNKDKPFFIAAGFYRPHCPWVTPGKYYDMYNLRDMNLPEISETTTKDYPGPALSSTNPWPYFGINQDQALECKLAYYAAISFVDAQIGKLLVALDELGLADNTIIVFWSDHGYHLGEHGLWFKQSCFEESAKSPLIISVPGNRSNGKLCRRIVELVDIYPTLAELTGLKAPGSIDGRSLMSLIKNPEAKWEHPAFTQVQRGNIPGHSVRTEKWRYTEWNFGKNAMELYDEVNDPKELRNLADDAKYSGVIKEMKALLYTVHPVPVKGGEPVEGTRKIYSD